MPEPQPPEQWGLPWLRQRPVRAPRRSVMQRHMSSVPEPVRCRWMRPERGYCPSEQGKLTASGWGPPSLSGKGWPLPPERGPAAKTAAGQGLKRTQPGQPFPGWMRPCLSPCCPGLHGPARAPPAGHPRRCPGMAWSAGSLFPAPAELSGCRDQPALRLLGTLWRLWLEPVPLRLPLHNRRVGFPHGYQSGTLKARTCVEP